jgi:hypothetical protein
MLFDRLFSLNKLSILFQCLHSLKYYLTLIESKQKQLVTKKISISFEQSISTVSYYDDQQNEVFKLQINY